MRPLSTEARAALNAGKNAWFVRLELTNGTRRGYTSYDNPIEIDTVLYKPGITPAQHRSDLILEPASNEFSGFFSDDDITEADVIAGVLDGATATVFVASWALPPQAITDDQCVVLTVASLGKARWGNNQFNFEALSSETNFAKNLRKITQPTCRATLGDQRCTVAIAPYRFVGIVGTPTNQIDFTFTVESQNAQAQPSTPGFYGNGRIEWGSGGNSGTRSKIRIHNGPGISLLQEPFRAIAPGDRFVCQVGCDKTLNGGCVKFANTLNFRGEPFVPGPDAQLRSPG